MSYDWRKAIVTQSATIRDALKILDSEALRIALVADPDDTLRGVITDGDVRRGLLRQVDLDGPVSQIMNAAPLTCAPSVPVEEVQKTLDIKKLLHMPIVDQGRLVGLHTHDSHAHKPSYENPVFLMAGGFGTRLRPLTDQCPKPLLKVGEKPLLETILKSFVNAGFSNFYMSLHYLPEMIIDYFGDGSKWGINIDYVQEDTPLGTGGALGLLPKELPPGPLILMNGDVLTKIDFENMLQFHCEHAGIATMCVREFDLQVPYGVIEAKGHKITKIEEKPVHQFFVNAGIYVLERILIDEVEKGNYIDMPTLLENKIKQGNTVSMFPVHEYWLDIGRMQDYERAQKDFSEEFV